MSAIEGSKAGSRKRVLVVAYYFPPMALSGVQRITKFVKYLPAFGWEPTILTVDPGGYFAFDNSLLEDVAGIRVERTRSLDPTRLFGKGHTVQMPAERSRKRLAALSQLAFIPDNKVGWMPSALRRGHALVEEHRFDAILSTAPPYTTHLIASRLSKRHGIPLIVDFRDDWTGNPRHTYPTRLHRRIHEWLEARVLDRADCVITINRVIRDALLERATNSSVPARVEMIPQGYDLSDMTRSVQAPSAEEFRLVYTGVFYDAQTPEYFLRAFSQMIQRFGTAHHVQAVFVGHVPALFDALIDNLKLGDHVQCTGYVPHAEAITHMNQATILWMTVGSGAGQDSISTGKLFEYFGTRKPILGLVPDGAARSALEKYEASYIAEPESIEAICTALSHAYHDWENGRLPLPNEEVVQAHDRRRLTEHLASMLDDIM